MKIQFIKQVFWVVWLVFSFGFAVATVHGQMTRDHLTIAQQTDDINEIRKDIALQHNSYAAISAKLDMVVQDTTLIKEMMMRSYKDDKR